MEDMLGGIHGEVSAVSTGPDFGAIVGADMAVRETDDFGNAYGDEPYFIPSCGGASVTPGCFELNEDGTAMEHCWYRVEQFLYALVDQSVQGDGLYALRIPASNPGGATVQVYGTLVAFNEAAVNMDYSYVPLYMISTSNGEKTVIDLRTIPTAQAWCTSVSFPAGS